MKDKDFEDFIRKNPNEALRLIVKAFKESKFDVKDLLPNGGSSQTLDPSPIGRVLRDPSARALLQVPETALKVRLGGTSTGEWTSDVVEGRSIIAYQDVTVPTDAKKCKIWALICGSTVCMCSKAYPVAIHKPFGIVAFGNGAAWNFEVSSEVVTPFVYELVKTGAVLDTVMRVEVVNTHTVYADATNPMRVGWTFNLLLLYEWLYG